MKLMQTSFGLTRWAGVLTLLLTVFSTLALADAPLLEPQLVIQKTSDQLQVSLQKPEYKGDFKKATHYVDSVIEPHIDFERVSVMILGKLWKTATPDQKERFKKEFRMLLVRTYTTAFTEYADWKIRYLPLDMTPADKKVIVRTEILQSGAQPVGVDYRMILEGGAWKVYDVLIEGVSLLQNYRTSFTEEVSRTGSLDKLIEHLADRNADALKEPVNKKGS